MAKGRRSEMRLITAAKSQRAAGNILVRLGGKITTRQRYGYDPMSDKAGCGETAFPMVANLTDYRSVTLPRLTLDIAG